MLLNYHVSAKSCTNIFPYLLEKRNLTAIPLILIPEYGQSNATLNRSFISSTQGHGFAMVISGCAGVSWLQCETVVFSHCRDSPHIHSDNKELSNTGEYNKQSQHPSKGGRKLHMPGH